MSRVKSMLGDAVEEWPGNRFAAGPPGEELVVWAPPDGSQAWQISSGCWLPGGYESELAAWFAFDFHVEQLQDLQEQKIRDNTNPIKLEDLVMIRVRELVQGEGSSPDAVSALVSAARKVVSFHGRSCSDAIEQLHQALEVLDESRAEGPTSNGSKI